MMRGLAFVVGGTAASVIATGALIRLGEWFARAAAPSDFYAWSLSIVAAFAVTGLIIWRAAE